MDDTHDLKQEDTVPLAQEGPPAESTESANLTDDPNEITDPVQDTSDVQVGMVDTNVSQNAEAVSAPVNPDHVAETAPVPEDGDAEPEDAEMGGVDDDDAKMEGGSPDKTLGEDGTQTPAPANHLQPASKTTFPCQFFLPREFEES